MGLSSCGERLMYVSRVRYLRVHVLKLTGSQQGTVGEKERKADDVLYLVGEKRGKLAGTGWSSTFLSKAFFHLVVMLLFLLLLQLARLANGKESSCGFDIDN